MINVAELRRTMKPELRLLRFSWQVLMWASDVSLKIMVALVLLSFIISARAPFGYMPGRALWWPRRFYGYRRGR
jgi:hypothetical protein